MIIKVTMIIISMDKNHCCSFFTNLFYQPFLINTCIYFDFSVHTSMMILITIITMTRFARTPWKRRTRSCLPATRSRTSRQTCQQADLCSFLCTPVFIKSLYLLNKDFCAICILLTFVNGCFPKTLGLRNLTS